MADIAAVKRALIAQLGTRGWSCHDGTLARLHPPAPPIPGDTVMIQRERGDTPPGWTYADNGWCWRIWTADDHWPFEYPEKTENGGMVSHVHDPIRCGEKSAEPCESCGTRLRRDRNAFGESEWQWEAFPEEVAIPEHERLAPSSRRFRYHPHDHLRCAECRALSVKQRADV